MLCQSVSETSGCLGTGIFKEPDRTGLWSLPGFSTLLPVGNPFQLLFETGCDTPKNLKPQLRNLPVKQNQEFSNSDIIYVDK